MSNQLTTLPENLCLIYKNLKSFDVSNNSICPPYPACFEYIGYQNTQNCTFSDITDQESLDNINDNSGIISSLSDITDINSIYFENDLEVLRSFIDNNESLKGMLPLEVGNQTWSNMRLISLDLSSAGLTNIPVKLCNIYSNLTAFDIGNNAICPPYPNCIEYISNQDVTTCGSFSCPDEYTQIEGECYYESHLNVLQDIINGNTSLQGLKPLEIIGESGLQKWKNGRLDQLIISDRQLTSFPESICTIYEQLSVFDISNNSICPPYPSCVENTGYQNIDDCNQSMACLDGHVTFDNKCYYYTDLAVLIDFTKANPAIENYHPLLLGYQVWKNNRLQQLYLNDMNITIIPESIHNLDHLEYLNLNNNKLEILPENLCKIYSNLKSFDITNNSICPPYLYCFDFIGQQDTKNCKQDFCPHGYTDIDEECYYQKDISVLQDFIDDNESLSGRKPLEIGVQKWKNMRLDFLYLGVNQLSIIPDSICEIISNLTTLNISQNNICPPYPICIEEYLGEQDTSGCPQ